MSESGNHESARAGRAQELMVSVALCTHNGEKFLEEQVVSILHQAEAVAEIVLSDDASTDASVSLVQTVVERHRAEHATELPALVVLTNSTALGVTANFEQAVRACSGDLIALSDQDDVWHPERLTEILYEFRTRPALTLLHHDARLVDEKGKSLGASLSQAIGLSASEQRREARGDTFSVLLQRNTVTGATTVFRRELLAHAVPFPRAWVHDEWLAIVASLVGTVDFLPSALIDYRQHSANQIGARKPTLGDKVGRLVEKRSERNRRLESRAASLSERVQHMAGATERQRALVQQKAAHEKWRSALPSSRLKRIVPVFGAALRGRYHRFGRARYDILRDLLQPAR